MAAPEMRLQPNQLNDSEKKPDLRIIKDEKNAYEKHPSLDYLKRRDLTIEKTLKAKARDTEIAGRVERARKKINEIKENGGTLPTLKELEEKGLQIDETPGRTARINERNRQIETIQNSSGPHTANNAWNKLVGKPEYVDVSEKYIGETNEEKLKDAIKALKAVGIKVKKNGKLSFLSARKIARARKKGEPQALLELVDEYYEIEAKVTYDKNDNA